jgi:transcription-repair coupling factor (superfamily II helicase)
VLGIAGFLDRREIDGSAAELIDRFGSLSAEVENLLEIIAVKRYCREAHPAKTEVETALPAPPAVVKSRVARRA